MSEDEMSAEERARSNSSFYHYAGLNSGRHQREREILDELQLRVDDLRSCAKQDSCQELADIVEVCMDDIQYRRDWDPESYFSETRVAEREQKIAARRARWAAELTEEAAQEPKEN
jgi:hypothetical protein